MRNHLRVGALAIFAVVLSTNFTQAQPQSSDCADGSCDSKRRGFPVLRLLVPGRDQPPEQYKSHGCWSHHNAYLCSSLRAEIRFIFGSCRTFYGEPCLPQPTHHYDDPILGVGRHRGSNGVPPAGPGLPPAHP